MNMKVRKYTIAFLILTCFVCINMLSVNNNNETISNLSISQLIANANPWDTETWYSDNSDNPGSIGVDGEKCYVVTSFSPSVGGSTTYSQTTGNETGASVTINFTGGEAGVNGSVTTTNGSSSTSTWQSTSNNTFIGYNTICDDNYVTTENLCRPISCNELEHAMF